jgi:hypothetical protein
MKWKKIVVVNILCCLFLLNMAVAQPPCNDEIIMNVKGNWKKRPDALMKTDYPAQVVSHLDAISNFFKLAYPEPKGMEAGWYKTMSGNPVIKNGPIPYQFNSIYQDWYCNTNVKKLLLADETGTWAYAFVNDFGWFISNQFDLLNIKINADNVYVLPSEKGKWKGYSIYEAYAHGDKGRCIILTHNNQVPWKPITQQQYLQALKSFWKKQKQDTDDGYTKQEEELKKGITAIQNSTLKQADKDPIIAGLKKNLDDLPKRKAEFITKDDKFRNDKISVVDKYISENPALLQQPAIMERRLADDFAGSFSTLEKGGQMLVMIAPGYFNRQLPLYAAQMIVLYWRWANDAPSRNFKKQFEENFPVEKLQAMIDK